MEEKSPLFKDKVLYYDWEGSHHDICFLVEQMYLLEQSRNILLSEVLENNEGAISGALARLRASKIRD